MKIHRPLHETISLGFYAAMSLIYIAAGVFFLLFKQGRVLLEPPLNYVFGGFTLLYGIFRLVNSLLRLRRGN